MGGSHPSDRRPDDRVGSAGSGAAHDGAQTAEQKAVTDMGSDGRADGDRHAGWSSAGEEGRDPPNPGGASGGHANRKAPRSPHEDENIVQDQSKAEKERIAREGR